MPLPSLVWNHFFRGSTKFGTDKNHWNVWCKACIARKVSFCRASELDAIARNEQYTTARSEKEIEDSLLATESPMCGKVEKMWSHLSQCREVAESVSMAAKQELQNRKHTKANKENVQLLPPLLRTPSLLSHSGPGPPTQENSLLSIFSESANCSATTSSIDDRTQIESSKHQFRTEQDCHAAIHTGSSTFRGAFGVPQEQWSSETQHEFNADLCRLMIACNMAWWAVELPYWRHFFHKWLSQCSMPGRTELSGRVLDEEAMKVIVKMKDQISGQYATGLCDGWKNITKASLVACMVNVNYKPYLLNTFDMSALPKTADTLLSLVLSEIYYAASVLGVWVIAWCTDAGGDAAKMRRLLKVKIPRIITVDCWAHQINLVVGDFFKSKNIIITVVDDALEVVKWFNNHTRALGLLRNIQQSKLRKTLSLILPVLTRWTSHYLSVRRLLDLEICFKQLLLDHTTDLLLVAGSKREQKEKAQSILNILEGFNFWGNLRLVNTYLEPLAIAANATQSDGARLDIVVLTLVNLYRIFSNPSLEQSVCATIQASLEKRWKQSDRPIFMLAVVFNPYLRVRCFATGSEYRSFAKLWPLVQDAYMRIFNTNNRPNDEFRTTFREYIKGEGRWSDQCLDLEYHQNAARKKKAPVNLLAIWGEQEPAADGLSVDRAHDFESGSPPNGLVGLVRVAIIILSIVPNSAAVERIFSQFGVVHTKLRNRLHPEKVRKTVLVRSDIATTYGVITRKKRKFSAVDDASDDDDNSGDDSDHANLPPTVSQTPTRSHSAAATALVVPNTSNVTPPFHSETPTDQIPHSHLFLATARELITDATEADESLELASENTGISLPAHQTAVTVPSEPQHHALSLAALFHYPTTRNSTSGATSLSSLMEFWQHGEQGLNNEIEHHEAIYSSI